MEQIDVIMDSTMATIYVDGQIDTAIWLVASWNSGLSIVEGGLVNGSICGDRIGQISLVLETASGDTKYYERLPLNQPSPRSIYKLLDRLADRYDVHEQLSGAMEEFLQVASGGVIPTGITEFENTKGTHWNSIKCTSAMTIGAMEVGMLTTPKWWCAPELYHAIAREPARASSEDPPDPTTQNPTCLTTQYIRKFMENGSFAFAHVTALATVLGQTCRGDIMTMYGLTGARLRTVFDESLCQENLPHDFLMKSSGDDNYMSLCLARICQRLYLYAHRTPHFAARLRRYITEVPLALRQRTWPNHQKMVPTTVPPGGMLALTGRLPHWHGVSTTGKTTLMPGVPFEGERDRVHTWRSHALKTLETRQREPAIVASTRTCMQNST